MSEWIPVSEQLPEMIRIYEGGPKRSKDVIIYNGLWVSVGTIEETYKRRTIGWKNKFGHNTMVTHWMHLPPPPKEQP